MAQSDISLKWFRQLTLPELERLGFSAGNLALEERAGDADQQRHLARQLVATKPDVILAIGNNAVAAAREATTSVPIVMSGIDPVVLGLATSLSRPGGNVTGVAIFATELDAKRLELLHEALPAARKVGVLIDASSPSKTPPSAS